MTELLGLRVERVILVSWGVTELSAVTQELHKIMGFQEGWIFLCNRRAVRDGAVVVIGARYDQKVLGS